MLLLHFDYKKQRYDFYSLITAFYNKNYSMLINNATSAHTPSPTNPLIFIKQADTPAHRRE